MHAEPMQYPEYRDVNKEKIWTLITMFINVTFYICIMSCELLKHYQILSMF